MRGRRAVRQRRSEWHVRQGRHAATRTVRWLTCGHRTRGGRRAGGGGGGKADNATGLRWLRLRYPFSHPVTLPSRTEERSNESCAEQGTAQCRCMAWRRRVSRRGETRKERARERDCVGEAQWELEGQISNDGCYGSTSTVSPLPQTVSLPAGMSELLVEAKTRWWAMWRGSVHGSARRQASQRLACYCVRRPPATDTVFCAVWGRYGCSVVSRSHVQQTAEHSR